MNSLRNIYLSKRFYLIAAIMAVSFVFSYFFPTIFPVVRLVLLLLLLLLGIDISMLFRFRQGVLARRNLPQKLSNGDHNEIQIIVENRYPLPVSILLFEELPHQFQIRDQQFNLELNKGEEKKLNYLLRPIKRGEYSFGAVNLLVKTAMGLVWRRYRFQEEEIIPVYPSYIQMKKYELLAISNNLTLGGIKKIRRIGHNMEFEQIKEYVPGDDVRSINWKATARRSELMVNNYQDEKSQQVFCLIDKGRVMQMPFDGLSLLDYAINASLVISNIAVNKEDKAGIITFQHRVGNILPAGKRKNQIRLIQELLYNQKTAFRESDFSRLYTAVRSNIRQRSLLLLFTNFESKVSLDRQMRYMTALARSHVLVVVFFENTELDDLLKAPAADLREVFHKAVGEKFAFEKRLIVRELQKHGIHTVLTRPSDLTVNTINKYLELKARGVI